MPDAIVRPGYRMRQATGPIQVSNATDVRSAWNCGVRIEAALKWSTACPGRERRSIRALLIRCKVYKVCYCKLLVGKVGRLPSDMIAGGARN